MPNQLQEKLEDLEPLDRVQTIVECAHAANPQVREALADALAEASYRFAVHSTLALLTTDDDPKVRMAAIRATRCRFRHAPRLYRRLLNKAVSEHVNRQDVSL